MAAPASAREFRILLRNLVIVTALAVALYLLFTIYRHQVLFAFTNPEVVLLEAGAVVLVAYATARAVTATSNAVLAQRNQLRHGATVRLFLNLLVAVGGALALSDLAGVSAQSIFLGSAFAGIVLGLAAQTVLANVFAGLLLVVANPFRPGDRVSLVTSSLGVLAPSYPHEAMMPTYSGVVDDVGLVYTLLRLDSGETAKVPNSVVLGALLIHRPVGGLSAYRVRMTFPLSVSLAMVEGALPELAEEEAGASSRPAPRLEVADISPTSWDGVVVVWSRSLSENAVRDRVARRVLRRIAPTDAAGSSSSRPRTTP
jgi:small-conductance mechanosensitive channel